MNILNNKNKRTSIFKALALCLFAAVSFTFVSCDDDMDIQQSYPFTVETMPVPNKVTKGQTVEIRCELKKTGDFANTLYTIRYFQFEGEGTLKMDNGITFLPNDRYLLENEKFRLYYTAQGDEAHNFIVVVHRFYYPLSVPFVSSFPFISLRKIRKAFDICFFTVSGLISNRSATCL